MEPRDSSLTQLQNEDSAVAAALGKEAALLFKSGKYSDCIRTLNQLLQKKENDPKIFHNIAIAESFQDGCSDPKRILEVLNHIKKKSEELAHVSSECVEAVNSISNKSVIGSKGANGVAQFSTDNSSSIVYADEFNNFVATFNMAVIWFCLHEYSKSFSILEPLYMNIEPINEKTALQICLLLLDVALLSRNASRYADVICYLEKVFCVNSLISQGDNGSSMQQQSSNLLPKSLPASGSSTISDVSNAESVSTANASESPLVRTLSDETEYETLLSSLDISGQNPQKPSAVHSLNDLPRSQADDSMSTIDLRLKLHLYKVQFLLLTRNLKAAKREVKLAMNIACGRDYSMALFLKSQLEYARGNHHKAIKLLKASTNQSEMGTLSMYYNNLGCIYYRLGKHYASNIFFSKALNISSSLQKEKPRKLSTFSQDKSLLILYNCGVQYLACGKPILAARCFYKATSIFYNRPLLWLRIAECCLMALEKGLLKSGAVSSDKSEIKIHVIGKGKWRQLVIEDGILRNGLVDFVGKENLLLGDDKQPKLSMSLARQSLLNAFHLLNCSELEFSNTVLSLNSLEENESNDTSRDTNHKSVPDDGPKACKVSANGEMKEQKGVNSVNASLQSSISDYEAICRKENLMIKQALYADLAFIELELGNPLKALLAARSLLRLPECFRIYVFLGNVYAAEALCLLNRPKEATEHLLVYLSGGNVELPYTQDDCKQCQVDKNMEYEESNGGSGHASSTEESRRLVFLKPEEARGALYTNLATLSAMQGDLNQAHQYAAKAVSAMPNSPEAILTAIYVDLMCGKSGEALSKLKQFSHVRFHPGSLTLSGLS